MSDFACSFVQDTGTIEHPSLYYRCLTIGRVWVHSIGLSGNGFWSPSQTGNCECPANDDYATALDELWSGIDLKPMDKFEQLKEVLDAMDFSVAPPALATAKAQQLVNVWWS